MDQNKHCCQAWAHCGIGLCFETQSISNPDGKCHTAVTNFRQGNLETPLPGAKSVIGGLSPITDPCTKTKITRFQQVSSDFYWMEVNHFYSRNHRNVTPKVFKNLQTPPSVPKSVIGGLRYIGIPCTKTKIPRFGRVWSEKNWVSRTTFPRNLR